MLRPYLAIFVRLNIKYKIQDQFSWKTTLLEIYESAGFDWENVKTLKVEERKFQQKKQKALVVQLQITSPHSENGLNQDGM